MRHRRGSGEQSSMSKDSHKRPVRLFTGTSMAAASARSTSSFVSRVPKPVVNYGMAAASSGHRKRVNLPRSVSIVSCDHRSEPCEFGTKRMQPFSRPESFKATIAVTRRYEQRQVRDLPKHKIASYVRLPALLAVSAVLHMTETAIFLRERPCIRL